MSNRLQHVDAALVRRPASVDFLRLVVSNERPRHAPDRPARLICRWSIDSTGRLVCAWEPAIHEPHEEA